MGTLAHYIGEETKTPPRDPIEAGFSVRTVLKGRAYSTQEAKEKVDAFERARHAERFGKVRQPAKKSV
jgi:hypothetical protein